MKGILEERMEGEKQSLLVSETESEHSEAGRRFNHREIKLKARGATTRSTTVKEKRVSLESSKEKALVSSIIVGSIPIESNKAEDIESEVFGNTQRSLRWGALTST